MISLGRSSVGRTRRRTASPLAIQQLYVAPKITAPSASNVKASLKRGRVRTLVSVPTPPRCLSAATPITASSSALVPEKLVTEVPWVPVPLQPFMDKLHPFMIKERRPLALLGLNTATNLGALCGHASFAILTAAYLETDVLTLRVLVLSGSTLNILFNLFRVAGPPVWIPIKWNVGFLALNALMVMMLLREREEAEELGKDPEKARIYEEIFMPVQLSPVHFLRLMDVAERRVMLKGNDLTQEGRRHEEVFLIVEGTAEVKSEGVAVSHLESGGFVGSMAFNRFIKATSAGASDDGGLGYHDGGMFRKAWKGLLHTLRKEGSVVGEVAKSVAGDKKRKRQDTSGMEISHNTVSATSDVVAYVWDVHALRAFVKRSPLIGASLQKAISADLVNKVDQSRDHRVHYQQLLAETLDGGRITSIERRNLQRYREEHRISMAEHKERLADQEWTEEEFEAGFQEGVAPEDLSEGFLKYEALLRNELAKGEVKPEARTNLRNFRTRAGIDAQEHLLAIEKQGWTADEYELGGRAWAADNKYDVDGGASMPADFDETDDLTETELAAGQTGSGRADKERYRSLLAEALGGKVIRPEQRRALARRREELDISSEEHRDLLREEGWSEEDYAAGFHKATFFQQFAAFVKSELAEAEAKKNKKPKEDKSNLRNFITRRGDGAEDHVLPDESQDWTVDGFEARIGQREDEANASPKERD